MIEKGTEGVENKMQSYQDPSPFKHGTSIGKGSNFFSLSLMIKSLGMSSEMLQCIFKGTVPGIWISGGISPSIN